MIFDIGQAELAERLRKELEAMDAWTPRRQLDYLIRLGVKNREARFTKDFGGEELPEPASVPMLDIPAGEAKPLVRLLYMLKHADDICLDGPTARSITGEPRVASLVRLINKAVRDGYARQTDDRELTESDRAFVFGVKLTDEGRQLLESILQLSDPADPQAPPAR